MNTFRTDIDALLTDRRQWPVLGSLFFASLLVVSMLYSPFLLSISMWGLVGMGIWYNFLLLPPKSNIVRVLANGFVRWWRRPELVALSLLFWFPVVSGFWSDDLGQWLIRVRVRLPFFVLAWAFANLPPIEKRLREWPLWVLYTTLVVSCIGIGINFLLHYEAIMDGMRMGQSIPVPRNHIRFNLILATGILWGIRKIWKGNRHWALLTSCAFLFLFIHILSVRSGLAALYGALGFALLWFVWESKKWGYGILIALSLGLGLFAAIQYVPSLAQKINYMKYDWEQFISKKGSGYSDSERWISLDVGLSLWKEHPVLGVGTGDLKSATIQRTQELFPVYEPSPKLPHNQFIYCLAGTGLLGLALTLIGFYFPLYYNRAYTWFLVSAFQIISFVSFLAEYTIETAMGVAFYIFFTLWFLVIGKE
ncbi:MAG: O-antigen ligase family protein [Saprospiraceae bacterium]